MLAAAQTSVPVWTWLFFGFVLFVAAAVVAVGMQRAGGGREAARQRRAGRGLTPEQQAFQDEMRLMLEARLRERDEPREPPAG